MTFKLLPRKSDAHKGNFGRVMLIGGSRGMSGAIALSSIAALKTGAGLVSAVVPDRCLETVAAFHPGIMTIPLADTSDGQFAATAGVETLKLAELFESKDVIACGPGMRTGEGASQLVERLLQHSQTPRVLDADALNVIAARKLFDSPALPRDQTRLVITPHPGELARLTDVPADRREEQISAAEALVAKLGLTVVVKGGPTVVVSLGESGSIERHVNATGNPGMATAGSGDVLTGIITALVGQGLPANEAARSGVYLHGLAGDIAADSETQTGLTCVDLLDRIPLALGRMETAEGNELH
ncbi:MAG: NAD(P)H-hydrate dehydratase [Planctomycetota bacterium]